MAQAHTRHRNQDKPSSSCNECRRRKQKCDQRQPCSNCARRFPQPECEYASHTNRSRRANRQLNPAVSEAITKRLGLYAHNNYAPIHDALLQLDVHWNAQPNGTTLPLRAGPGAAGAAAQDDLEEMVPIYPPSSPGSAPREPQYFTDNDEFNGHFRNWLPFRLAMPAKQGSSSNNKSLMAALRMLMEPRGGEPARLSVEDEWLLDAARLIWTAQGSLQPTVSLSKMDEEMRHLPMPLTRLNKELVRTHLRLLSRFKASVNGNPSPDNPFMKHWVPFIIQDALLIHTVLFASACFLNETGHLPKTVVVALRALMYQTLNQHLRENSTQTTDAAILAVTEMVLDEWYWGATKDLHAHMKGLKTMITMRGGLQDLGMNGYLSKLIIIHDISMALAHETTTEIYGHPGFEFTDSVTNPFQNSLNTPVTSAWPAFAECASSLRLHPCTTAILDDVRAMFNAILSLPSTPTYAQISHALAVAQWAQDHIAQLPENISMSVSRGPASGTASPSSSNRGASPRETTSPADGSKGQQHQHPSPSKTETIDRGTPPSEVPDPVYRMVRMTAIIYCRAILTRVPLSMICSDNEFLQIWILSWRIPMASRRSLIGIFTWVLLALAPSCHNKAQARFIKTLVVNAFMTIAVENWHFALEFADGSLKLQEWLKGASRVSRMVTGGEGIIEKHGFAQREVLQNIAHVHRGDDNEGDEQDEN